MELLEKAYKDKVNEINSGYNTENVKAVYRELAKLEKDTAISKIEIALSGDEIMEIAEDGVLRIARIRMPQLPRPKAPIKTKSNVSWYPVPNTASFDTAEAYAFYALISTILVSLLLVLRRRRIVK